MERPIETPAAVEPHPLAHEGWFAQLPAEHRERMEAEWRAGRARDEELARRARRQDRSDVLRFALPFPLADLLLCPQHTAGTFVAALLAGSALGVVLVRLDAERLSSGVAGAVAFFVFQLLSRGGLSAWHMWTFFPVAAVYSLIGYAREERGWG